MLGYQTEERIYALSTPFAPSALALIRLSGENTISSFQPCFSSKINKTGTNAVVHGFVKDDDGSIIDEVVIVKYEKGHGYTSEEAVEIMCHGSLAVIKSIMLRLEKLGFREALPGEFTYRAFMHGRID